MILTDLQAVPGTNPDNLIQLRDSIYAADLLITAVGHLDFFSWLNENPSDLKMICDHFKIKPRPADVMLTYFKALDLISNEKNLFSLTGKSKEFLTKKSFLFVFMFIPF